MQSNIRDKDKVIAVATSIAKRDYSTEDFGESIHSPRDPPKPQLIARPPAPLPPSLKKQKSVSYQIGGSARKVGDSSKVPKASPTAGKVKRRAIGLRVLKCPRCGKSDFENARELTKHAVKCKVKSGGIGKGKKLKAPAPTDRLGMLVYVKKMEIQKREEEKLKIEQVKVEKQMALLEKMDKIAAKREKAAIEKKMHAKKILEANKKEETKLHKIEESLTLAPSFQKRPTIGDSGDVSSSSSSDEDDDDEERTAHRALVKKRLAERKKLQNARIDSDKNLVSPIKCANALERVDSSDFKLLELQRRRAELAERKRQTSILAKEEAMFEQKQREHAQKMRKQEQAKLMAEQKKREDIKRKRAVAMARERAQRAKTRALEVDKEKKAAAEAAEKKRLEELERQKREKAERIAAEEAEKKRLDTLKKEKEEEEEKIVQELERTKVEEQKRLEQITKERAEKERLERESAEKKKRLEELEKETKIKLLEQEKIAAAEREKNEAREKEMRLKREKTKAVAAEEEKKQIAIMKIEKEEKKDAELTRSDENEKCEAKKEDIDSNNGGMHEEAENSHKTEIINEGENYYDNYEANQNIENDEQNWEYDANYMNEGYNDSNFFDDEANGTEELGYDIDDDDPIDEYDPKTDQENYHIDNDADQENYDIENTNVSAEDHDINYDNEDIGQGEDRGTASNTDEDKTSLVEQLCVDASETGQDGSNLGYFSEQHVSPGADGDECAPVVSPSYTDWLNCEYEGFTAAHMAAYHDDSDRMAYIIENGRDLLTEQDPDERNCMHMCCTYGNTEILELLLVMLDPTLRDTLALSADATGKTPLLWACEMAQFDAVALLIEACPDTMNVRDSEGNTPLHVCSMLGHLECLMMLLTFGANPDGPANDFNGLSPVHVASSVECLQPLIDYGADYYCTDFEGATVLFKSCSQNRLECTRYILDLDDEGILIDTPDYRGDTPVHAAACNGHIDCLKLILQSAACATLKNEQGLSPIYVAWCNSRTECVELLKEYGAVLNEEEGSHLAENVSGWAKVRGAVHMCKWKSCLDEASGHLYYWHTETNETTWEKPDDYKSDDEFDDIDAVATSESYGQQNENNGLIRKNSCILIPD